MWHDMARTTAPYRPARPAQPSAVDRAPDHRRSLAPPYCRQPSLRSSPQPSPARPGQPTMQAHHATLNNCFGYLLRCHLMFIGSCFKLSYAKKGFSVQKLCRFHPCDGLNVLASKTARETLLNLWWELKLKIWRSCTHPLIFSDLEIKEDGT